jgi:hypothetical protein
MGDLKVGERVGQAATSSRADDVFKQEMVSSPSHRIYTLCTFIFQSYNTDADLESENKNNEIATPRLTRPPHSLPVPER